jgi:hypothetical protein
MKRSTGGFCRRRSARFIRSGDLALISRGQPLICGRHGDEVGVAAHCPEKRSAFMEVTQLPAVGMQALFHLLLKRPHAHTHILPIPEERVEIAKTAFAFLELGLDDVAAVAHALWRSLSTLPAFR